VTITGRINDLDIKRLRPYFVTSLIMAIRASHRAALHFFVTAHALAMIGTLETYTRFSLRTFIMINDYGLMAFSTRGG